MKKFCKQEGRGKKAFKNFQHSFTLYYQIFIRKISVVTGKKNPKKNREKEKL